jgi:hypothetical protein
VPLVLVRSYGLVGYLKALMAEHCVIESKPDSKVDDLRWILARGQGSWGQEGKGARGHGTSVMGGKG